MKRVLTLELAILLQLKPIGMLSLVFHPRIISALALGALEEYFFSHDVKPTLKSLPLLFLFDYFGDDARADGTAALANCES